MIPPGAREILDLRLAGQRPAHPVLVSLIGPMRVTNGPCVSPEPGVAYDWRFIRGLEAHVWVRAGVAARRTFVDIALAGAWCPQAWDVELEEGAFVFVDPLPETEERIAAALESGSEGRLRAAVRRRYEEPLGAWLAPWGPIMNRNYAAAGGHMEIAPCKP